MCQYIQGLRISHKVLKQPIFTVEFSVEDMIPLGELENASTSLSQPNPKEEFP
jgi:hypothetical protein